MAEDLVLDTAIRDWVLIPLSVVMVLIGVLRYFVSKLMRSSPTPDAKIVKEGQVVIRARNLKAGANFIPPKSFRARRFYFSNEENGLLHVPKDQAQNPQAQMFSDPNMAMDMMKKNLSMIIPQTLTFAWVNFFFSGFVAAKIPFPLTQRFRAMLQNGIDLSTVDVSYVSSRSWYFLNLFGLRGLFSLILGDENAIDDTQHLFLLLLLLSSSARQTVRTASRGSSSSNRGSAALFELVGVEFFFTLRARRRRFLLQPHHEDLAQTAGDPRHSLRSSASSSSSDSPDSSASSSSPAASGLVGVEFFSSCITIWTPRVLAVLIYEFSSNLIPFKECFDSPDNR